ncbi:TetR/AcrR family transcriptional regulator [Nakamurella silvestris]|nr:TetR/AcrR family transcriptional regulator [Nakamurella silvestris]
MSATRRRELVLEAATRVFGDEGYAGATTDKVARAAGVSQPYVVRIFGTKENLFLEVMERAGNRLLAAFTEEIARIDSELALPHRLGLRYVTMLQDRGLVLSLMHGFALGADPVIGASARCGFMNIYRLVVNEGGFTPAEAYQFLAGGMMINTMLGLRMGDEFDTDPDVRDLLREAFPEKLDVFLAVTRSHQERA